MSDDDDEVVSDPLLIAEIDDLEHEIARLRTALKTAREALEEIARGYDGSQSISGSMCSDMARTALAALEPKP